MPMMQAPSDQNFSHTSPHPKNILHLNNQRYDSVTVKMSATLIVLNSRQKQTWCPISNSLVLPYLGDALALHIP